LKSKLSFRYVLSGGAATGFSIALFHALHTLFEGNLPAYILFTCSSVAGFILGFFLHRKFVFRSNSPIYSESIKYVKSNVLVFSQSVLFIWFTVDILKANHFWMSVLSSCLSFAIGYVLNRFWVFKGVEK
jgi:putative flippase GtrA